MVEYRPKEGAFFVVIDLDLPSRRIRAERRVEEYEPNRCREIEEELLAENLTAADRVAMGRKNALPKPGYIYAAKNALMPGMIKIGMTTGSAKARVRGLGTSAPVDFELIHAVKVRHVKTVETSLHKYLAKHRVNAGREFFAISEADAITALDAAFAVDGMKE